MEEEPRVYRLTLADGSSCTARMTAEDVLQSMLDASVHVAGNGCMVNFYYVMRAEPVAE